ncbi:MAG: cytochrome peroxidase [Bacteroidota bacterium]|jgi:cytochrome c peroxidase
MKNRIWFFLLLIFGACQNQPQCDCDNQLAKFRSYKILPPPVVPKDNPFTFCSIELGRKLFYDSRLSSDGQTSCGSCHSLVMAFTDGQPTAVGAHGKKGNRNSPTLFNLAWSPYFMMEGGVKTLELQGLAPLLTAHEMMGNPLALSNDILQDSCYQRMSQKAYNRPLDYFVVVRALANFQRSLISLDSHFDRVMYHKTEKFTPAEERGWKIFNSAQTKCVQCHQPPLFTDFGFYDIGLTDTMDQGKERESYRKTDRYKFKTPTLRNIELTPPYFHNGQIDRLEEVIEFYNRGGDANRTNQDARIHELNLNENEKKDLLIFLQTLTDWNAVQNKRWLPL